MSSRGCKASFSCRSLTELIRPVTAEALRWCRRVGIITIDRQLFINRSDIQEEMRTFKYAPTFYCNHAEWWSKLNADLHHQTPVFNNPHPSGESKQKLYTSQQPCTSNVCISSNVLVSQCAQHQLCGFNSKPRCSVCGPRVVTVKRSSISNKRLKYFIKFLTVKPNRRSENSSEAESTSVELESGGAVCTRGAVGDG